jgi:hypothetical protein
MEFESNEDQAADRNDTVGYEGADDLSDDALDLVSGGDDPTALAAQAVHKPPGPTP